MRGHGVCDLKEFLILDIKGHSIVYKYKMKINFKILGTPGFFQSSEEWFSPVHLEMNPLHDDGPPTKQGSFSAGSGPSLSTVQEQVPSYLLSKAL